MIARRELHGGDLLLKVGQLLLQVGVVGARLGEGGEELIDLGGKVGLGGGNLIGGLTLT